MVTPQTSLAHPSSVTIEYTRPLGHRLRGKFHRLPLLLASIAVASLLLPLATADAAVLNAPAEQPAAAMASGLEPAAQQREGRRGGGEFRGNRGGGGGREARGGGGREFRAQPRSNIGSARIDTPREFRQERRADRQDFRTERRGDVRDFRQERRGDQRDFRQERRADRQDFRQGEVTRPEFRADRRDDRRDFRQDRRGDTRDFRADRRGDVRDFRADRRDDRRDYRDNRRGWDGRGFASRGWDGGRDGRAWDGRGRDWNRGWRNDRRYDWVGYRNQNRNFYRVGRYYPPVRGWNYRRLNIGFTLGAPFFASSFWINDPWAYRLPPAYGQYRWVRYYGDVLLVDVYTGQVVDVINDFFW
ncbi:RcnB family protein [Blastomonas sp. AAP53]|uniref:RcnB family protein n=1 Tax=Blastomonas sp. AAP53 TaxID=1248760 RepID=UPI001EE681D2|nr:RcnB family protein [Blastomonas sp. AAP53]